MVAYFDIENLNSFLNQPKDDFYADCAKLLKKQLDLVFNFPKEEIKRSDLLMSFFRTLTEGIEGKVEFRQDKFPERNIKSNSHINFTNDELLSVYFINDRDLKKLKNKDELLIAEIGEELAMFKLLFLYNQDYSFERKFRIGKEFDGWDKLTEFYSPFIDLIIVDNFILKDKDLFETNICGLIENMLKSKVRKKINIIVFLKADQQNVDYSQFKTNLSNIVKKRCIDPPCITVIKHYGEHDRTILKNFIRIYSGDTFNYFSPSGSKITKGKEIHFSSIAKKENYNLYLQLLKDLQDIINKVSPENIVGDKKSRLLKFPT